MQSNYKPHSNGESQMMNIVMAGVVGATVATVAAAMTNKKNRQRLRDVYDYLMERTENLQDLASQAWDDVEDEAVDVKNRVRRQIGRASDKAEDVANTVSKKARG